MPWKPRDASIILRPHWNVAAAWNLTLPGAPHNTARFDCRPNQPHDLKTVGFPRPWQKQTPRHPLEVPPGNAGVCQKPQRDLPPCPPVPIFLLFEIKTTRGPPWPTTGRGFAAAFRSIPVRRRPAKGNDLEGRRVLEVSPARAVHHAERSWWPGGGLSKGRTVFPGLLQSGSVVAGMAPHECPE